MNLELDRYAVRVYPLGRRSAGRPVYSWTVLCDGKRVDGGEIAATHLAGAESHAKVKAVHHAQEQYEKRMGWVR